MSGLAGAERPCFICGHGIPLDEFVEWPDVTDSTYASCGRCGAPNERRDKAFVVLDQAQPSELPAVVMDVFPVVGGGWRACCECGLTEAVSTQANGWSWVLDHDCMPLSRLQPFGLPD